MKRIFKTSLLLLTAILLITLVSCDPTKKYEKEENQTILNYLAANPAMTFELKPSGLYYLEVLAGTGLAPATHDTAYIKYTGKFLDGTVFDSNILNSRTDTLVVPVNEGWLITGFDEGLTYMRVGGKATFLVPSTLGYGPNGRYPYIQGYQPLLFDVQLVKVRRSSAK